MTTSLFKLEFVLLFDRMIRAVGQLTFQHKCSYQADLDINYIFWGVSVCSLQFQKSVHYLYDPPGC